VRASGISYVLRDRGDVSGRGNHRAPWHSWEGSRNRGTRSAIRGLASSRTECQHGLCRFTGGAQTPTQAPGATRGVYSATSQIYGDKRAGFSNSSEYLVGMNFYSMNTRNLD